MDKLLTLVSKIALDEDLKEAIFLSSNAQWLEYQVFLKIQMHVCLKQKSLNLKLLNCQIISQALPLTVHPKKSRLRDNQDDLRVRL